MVEVIKSYEKYKGSSVAWLGDIPEHWEVRKLKYSVTINDETLPENTEKQFSFDYIDIESVREGKILERRKMTFETSPSRARRIVKNGDVIVSTVRTYLKAIVQIKDLKNSTIVSTGFAVLRPSKLLGEEFLNYCVRAKSFIEKVVAFSTGVGYPAITATRLSNIEVIIPTLPEQTAIANFLDYKTAKIDRFVFKKKQLIKLLNEQKAGIINDAVTRGLNPNANMKPSGIEWLGDIPEHWEVRKLKYSVGLNKHQSFDNAENSSNKIALENIESKSGRIIDLGRAVFEGVGTIFKKGDVLFGKLRPYLAKVISPEFEGSCVNEILVLTPNTFVWNTEFLKFRMLSPDFIKVVNDSTFGAKMPRASWSFIGSLKVGRPTIDEQLQIVSYINKETSIITKTIATIEKEITLVQEYRTALIAEAVTGKIDVRDYKVPALGEEDLVTEELEDEMDMVGEEGENEDNNNF